MNTIYVEQSVLEQAFILLNSIYEKDKEKAVKQVKMLAELTKYYKFKIVSFANWRPASAIIDFLSSGLYQSYVEYVNNNLSLSFLSSYYTAVFPLIFTENVIMLKASNYFVKVREELLSYFEQEEECYFLVSDFNGKQFTRITDNVRPLQLDFYSRIIDAFSNEEERERIQIESLEVFQQFYNRTIQWVEASLTVKLTLNEALQKIKELPTNNVIIGGSTSLLFNTVFSDTERLIGDIDLIARTQSHFYHLVELLNDRGYITRDYINGYILTDGKNGNHAMFHKDGVKYCLFLNNQEESVKPNIFYSRTNREMLLEVADIKYILHAKLAMLGQPHAGVETKAKHVRDIERINNYLKHNK